VSQATINDVAELAGVSRSTVSLVLRGSTRVADDTQTRVREAIRRLGYRPSHFAAGLRSQRSHIVGLVVSSLTFPHHAHIAVGVERAIEEAGYGVLVANSRQDVQRERGHIERLRRYRADGVVITPLQIAPAEAQHLAALRAEGYPVVTAYREIPGLEVDFAGVDARDSVYQAVAHLLDLGHRRIAFLSGEAGNPVHALRVAGWRDALRERGVPADDALLVTGSASDSTGYTGQTAAEALLARGVTFTALVGANDFFALGALRTLHQVGRRVPQDVSVVGIGGFDPIMSPEKRLTTVAHDFELVGRTAGELLLERMSHPGTPSPERRIVPAHMRPGETTASAPN
jgi:LacI family transcriptional regulator